MEDKKPLARACFALKTDRLTVYMNLEAIAFLRERLALLMKSDPADHYEIHLSTDLEGDRKFDPTLEPRAWALVTPSLFPHIVHRGQHIVVDGDSVELLPFDLNFMVVTESELDAYAMHEASGILPDIPDDER